MQAKEKDRERNIGVHALHRHIFATCQYFVVAFPSCDTMALLCTERRKEGDNIDYTYTHTIVLTTCSLKTLSNKQTGVGMSVLEEERERYCPSSSIVGCFLLHQ